MKNYIPSLNGFRAISVLIVFLSHVQIRYIGPRAWVDNVPLIFTGQLGVNTFFIISGFLITSLLLLEEKETGKVSLKNFYLRRVYRIFPLYFTLLGVYAIFEMFGIGRIKPISWFGALTFTKYFYGLGDWNTAHLWSISIEEHFYLIWPFVFVFMKKHRIKFAFAIVILSPVFRLLMYQLRIHPFAPMVPLPFRADSLMWGCIFAIYHKQIWEKIELIYNKFKPSILVPLLLLLMADRNVIERILYTPTVIAFDNKHHLHLWLVRVFNTTFGHEYGTIAAVSTAIIILFSINKSGNLWYKFLNSAPMNYIGKLSYSIYIWQQMYLSYDLSWFDNVVKSIFGTAITAVASYNLIEKPFLKLKDRFHNTNEVPPKPKEEQATTLL